MSRGNSSNDGNRNSGGENDEGWGSKFFKAASVAVATAAVAGGLYALMSSSPQQSPFEAPARRVIKEPDDDEEDSFGAPTSPFRAPAFHFEALERCVIKELDDDEEDDNEAPALKIRWTKPKPGWVKLNVDGSRDHISNRPSSGCGGVMRDDKGEWLLGFAQKLDPSCEVHETELEAILKGVELALERKYKKLVVESDHKSAVSMVEKGVKENHQQYTIISRIRQLISDPKWEVEVFHVPRTANRVANKLAIGARDLSSEYMRKYPYSPANCDALVLEESQGDAVGYY